MLILAGHCSFCQSVRVGISSDFEKTKDADSIFKAIVSEIDRTVGASGKVILPANQIIYGNKSLDQAQQSYNKLNATSDFILLIGSISTKGALQRLNFSTPTIAIGIVNPFLQDLPYQNGTSGKSNFSYIWPHQDIFKELAEFRRLVDFRNLSMLINASSAVTINNQKGLQLLDSLQETFSTEINIVPVGDNIDVALRAIPDNTDAIYISELTGKTASDIANIASELIIRKLPSFSSTQWHVEQGILGSIAEENDLAQIMRRLSLMVDDALSGGVLSQMSVDVNFKETYNLNLRTAKEIGLSPSFDLLFTSNLIDKDDTGKPKYSLMQILEQSMQKNLDIKLVFKDLDLTEQDILLARSSVLPDFGLSVSASQLNPDAANNFTPERQAAVQLVLNQLIYSEEAVASIKIAQYIREAQNYQTLSDILNVLLDTYVLYFNVLSAKTDVTIRRENLNNSLTNLELAKLKASTGTSTRSDIFRWESEVATARQAVIQSETVLIAAKLELNMLLANSLEEDFEIEDVTIEGSLFENFRSDRVSRLINRPTDFEILSDFLVQESVRANPNKHLLLENLKAIERTKLQDKRLLYLPSVSLQAQAGYVLGRGGIGSSETPGVNMVDYPWQIGVSLSYPVFRGNARRANLQKTSVQLEQINFSRTQLDQNLELLVRSNLLNALSASTNLGFSKVASDNAMNNFELVRDNYQQGTVIITQLIDAQNAALNARLNNALSVYNFMVAKLQVEFAVGFFSMLTPEEKLQDFEDRFEQYLNDNN